MFSFIPAVIGAFFLSFHASNRVLRSPIFAHRSLLTALRSHTNFPPTTTTPTQIMSRRSSTRPNFSVKEITTPYPYSYSLIMKTLYKQNRWLSHNCIIMPNTTQYNPTSEWQKYLHKINRLHIHHMCNNQQIPTHSCQIFNTLTKNPMTFNNVCVETNHIQGIPLNYKVNIWTTRWKSMNIMNTIPTNTYPTTLQPHYLMILM